MMMIIISGCNHMILCVMAMDCDISVEKNEDEADEDSDDENIVLAFS